jgi:hypothetical protein
MGALSDLFGTSDVPGANKDSDGTLIGQGWVQREVRDHASTGCPGTEFVDGRWGGIVCTTCGK